jgi:hypothetical protein
LGDGRIAIAKNNISRSLCIKTGKYGIITVWGVPTRRGRSLSGAPKSVKPKPRSFFSVNIGDRLQSQNRIPIVRSICVIAAQTGFQSLIDLKMKNADRF